ncbi:MAG TPA: cyclase family protein [Bryobacteraceae bacterium]|nr:cyclase family protein [Bryobacteraceae bacterium]
MSREFIDISIPLRNGMVNWPGDAPFSRIETLKIANGDVCNLSQFASSVHIGTHMDAPRHFLADGHGMETMPIAATVGLARVIAIHDPELIRIAELEQHHLSKNERVLFKTRNSEHHWKTHTFQERFVHIPQDTARYLATCGVQTVGVDYLSVGGYETDSAETHQALLEAGIWIIEGLNLEHVEPGNYELICLPLKLSGSDGAPARAVLRHI